MLFSSSPLLVLPPSSQPSASLLPQQSSFLPHVGYVDMMSLLLLMIQKIAPPSLSDISCLLKIRDMLLMLLEASYMPLGGEDTGCCRYRELLMKICSILMFIRR